MIERIYILESVDPVIFYGVNNSNMQLIKTLFPKLRIVARGNVMKVIGDEDESELFLKKIRTGDRSGKIRTYNFPQNRVTDHRLTGDVKNFNIAAVINGDLDPLIDALTLANQAQRLQEGTEKGE